MYYDYQTVTLRSDEIIVKAQDILDQFSAQGWRLVSTTCFSERNLEDKILFVFEREL
jgi:hypothetical protein